MMRYGLNRKSLKRDNLPAAVVVVGRGPGRERDWVLVHTYGGGKFDLWRRRKLQIRSFIASARMEDKSSKKGVLPHILAVRFLPS